MCILYPADSRRRLDRWLSSFTASYPGSYSLAIKAPQGATIDTVSKARVSPQPTRRIAARESDRERPNASQVIFPFDVTDIPGSEGNFFRIDGTRSMTSTHLHQRLNPYHPETCEGCLP